MRCECVSHNGFLTKAGFALVAQQRSLEGLTLLSDSVRLDIVGSVSALAEAEDSHVFDDQVIDQQYRRFHNGS